VSDRERIVGALAVGYAAVLLLRAEPAGSRPPIAGSPCARAVELDGVLLCDGAAPAVLGQVCATPDARPIASGDALRRALACAQDDPRRGGPGWGRMAPVGLGLLEQPVDVNRAAPEELATLPGVGPVIAAGIVAGRPYPSLEALERVRGLGEKRLRRLRPRARLEPEF